jgi:mRNA-degrading endonuclease toxin of MazEF toxin-antitoxin module
VKRGEIWWADLGPYRFREQTGRRPVVIWQSNVLTEVLQSVLLIPLTTNLERAHLAGTALVPDLKQSYRRIRLPLRFS